MKELILAAIRVILMMLLLVGYLNACNTGIQIDIAAHQVQHQIEQQVQDDTAFQMSVLDYEVVFAL